MKRDSQRSKMYKAERAFWNTHPAGSYRPKGLEELKEQVWAIWKDETVRKAFPEITSKSVPGVRRKRGGGAHASPYRNHLAFSKTTCQPWVVIHELSHMIHFYIAGSYDGEAWHGPEFAAIYLRLTEICYGFETREGLAAAFRQHRLKISPKIVRKA